MKLEKTHLSAVHVKNLFQVALDFSTSFPRIFIVFIRFAVLTPCSQFVFIFLLCCLREIFSADLLLSVIPSCRQGIFCLQFFCSMEERPDYITASDAVFNLHSNLDSVSAFWDSNDGLFSSVFRLITASLFFL